MALVATASKTVRNKNILVVVLCAVFAVWFGYDGLIGWPAANDDAIATMQKDPAKYDSKLDAHFAVASPDLAPREIVRIGSWKGWNQESLIRKTVLSNHIVHPDVNIKSELHWHSPLDITFQHVITVGLILTTGLAVWWAIRCQKRRATADEQALSPAPGVIIPWATIKTVDNTRWKKSGIVTLTYTGTTGAEMSAVLDEYHLDELRPLLQELATRAVNAEFSPRPEAPADVPAPQG